MEIGRFGGITFEVSAENVMSFTNLTIKGSSSTEETTKAKVGFVKRKESKSTEITLTVHADARLGADVYDVVMRFVEMAKNGTEDYFYVSSKKLFPYKLMLTDAQADGIVLSPTGIWVCADVKLTLKQSTGYDPNAEAAEAEKRERQNAYTDVNWVTEEPQTAASAKTGSGGSGSQKNVKHEKYNALVTKPSEMTEADEMTQALNAALKYIRTTTSMVSNKSAVSSARIASGGTRLNEQR